MVSVITGNKEIEEYLVKELLYREILFDDLVFESDVDRAVLSCDCLYIEYKQKARVILSFKARFWVYNKGKVLSIYSVSIEECARIVEIGMADEPVFKVQSWNDCRLYNKDADTALLNTNQYNRLTDYAKVVKHSADEVRRSLENIMQMTSELHEVNSQEIRTALTSSLTQLQAYASNAVEMKKHNNLKEMDITRTTRESKLTCYGDSAEGLCSLIIQ